MKNIDIVYHIAAQSHVPLSWKYPVETIKTNAIGSLNVLESAKEEGVELVIYAGSDKEYGNPKYLPLDEDHPLLISSPYATSKILGDMLFNMYHEDYGLPIIVPRLSNVYGPRQSAEKVIPSTILQLIKTKKLMIRYGKKNHTSARDFIFISDVIRALLDVCEQKEKCVGETINFGSGNAIHIEDVAQLIIDTIGLEIKPEFDEMPIQDIPIEQVSFEKAKKMLGWSPLVSLEDGLKQTIEWYKENKNIGWFSEGK